MAKYSVTLSKSFSTTVDVEADSIAEALDKSYHYEPTDNIVGFEWEPEGESEAYAVYDENNDQVWDRSDHKE